VPHARIPLWIRAADVFVLNSRYEGLSHTLLEVQALGTPIVASRVCGNPEVVEHGVDGLLVDPHDVSELARAVQRLLEDPGLAARFVEAGLARRDRFSREATFAEVEAALMRAADLRPSARPAAEPSR
jgi:glycosyltransferase involved in cell wall biosynthesis